MEVPLSENRLQVRQPTVGCGLYSDPAAVTQAEGILNGANIEVAAQRHEALMAGLTLTKLAPIKV